MPASGRIDINRVRDSRIEYSCQAEITTENGWHVGRELQVLAG